jgi:putative flippase GtrA
MRLNKQLIREFTAYTSVTAIGMALDLGVAFMLINLFSVSAVAAGTAGLIIGTIVNYLAHTKVTFAQEHLKPSWLGLFKYAQTCAVGAITRIAVLFILTALSSLNENLVLIIAVGASFSVNYLLSRHYVFRNHQK